MKTRTKTRTIPKTPFFAAFSVGAVLFSAHAGGGFATGNQANTYYVGLGWAGIVSAIVAMLLLTLTMREAMINLQANYDAELLELNEANTVTDEEKSVLQVLHEMIACLRKVQMIPNDQGKEDTVLSLRKAFHMSDISKLDTLVAGGAFRISKTATVDPMVMGAWLRLCQIIGEQDSNVISQ